METEAAEIRRSIEEATADLFDIEERKVRHRAEQLQARLKAVEAKSDVPKGPAVDQFVDAVSARTSHRFSSAPSPNTTLNNESAIGLAKLNATTATHIPQPFSNQLLATPPFSSYPDTNQRTGTLLERGCIQPTANILTSKTSSNRPPSSCVNHLDQNVVPMVRQSSTYQYPPIPEQPHLPTRKDSHSIRHDFTNQQTSNERESSRSEMDSPGAARHQRPSIRSEDMQWNAGGMDLSLRGDGSEDDGRAYMSRRGSSSNRRADEEDKDDRRRSKEQERYGLRPTFKTGSGSRNGPFSGREHDDENEDNYEHGEGRLRRAGMKRKNREDTGTGTSEAGGGKRQNFGAGKKRTKLELAKEIADDEDAYQLKGAKRCQTCRETKRRDRDDVCIVLMDIYGKKCSSCVKHGNKCEFSTSKHSAPSNKDPSASPSHGRGSAPATRSRSNKKKRDTRIPFSTILAELDGLTSKANKIVSKAKEIKRWIMEYEPQAGDELDEDDDDDDDDDEDDDDNNEDDD